ncbi:plastocyanin/azurin family copper-binding protein [Burkholderia stagnalis]|uniref:Blue (type 1) copper domain-containing protein n=1 Tax=Burkholderia stagnalis TaxID=1503054 RepID=A0ABX9YM74_9BURK|nr:plastocyanin/azurin family copper-binding protein [Burkholderia stagnalis]RQQ57473.1 hypothetical protein DF158_20595 [Burkholderia stagnalis]RQQ67048.1 hypothetical protein DF137_19670 [Burkholderia stagnalis]RQQ68629.1 hypothetical protein DF139_17570 [Burkholderia stagnalis]RQQ79254.1 hypothetical protein DF138_18510 [Burkholderia stagnalis]RQQ83933.1 hypothetical protein DF136_27785 [Burkholderia stagnalis]
MNMAWRTALVASVAALGIASQAARAQQTVKATLRSDAIQLEPHDVKAGRVTFDVVNSAGSDMAHELVVLKTDLADGALPVRKGLVQEARLHKIGEVEDIAPGRHKHLALTLAPGRYALICNKPGHYAAGMHAALVVTR